MIAVAIPIHNHRPAATVYGATVLTCGVMLLTMRLIGPFPMLELEMSRCAVIATDGREFLIETGNELRDRP